MSRLSLPLPLFVAQRYLRSSRRDSFVTFLSVTAGAGIALGVAALILSSSALTGFQQVLRDEVLTRSPHIEVALPPGTAVTALPDLAAIDGIRSTRIGLQGRGWFLAEGRAQPAEIVGFDGPLPDAFPEPTSRAAGLYVSDRLADRWGLTAGEIGEVVSARATLTPLGPQPRVRRIRTAGTFQAGRTEQSERVAIPLADAIHLFGEAGLRLLVTCDDYEQATQLAAVLQSQLPEGSTVDTWKDLNKALLFLLRLEKTLMFVAVFLIVVVAAMAVVSDLMLILAHKQSELGMLGAMGARPEELRRIFLWLGALLVAVGATIGAVLGIGLAILLDRQRLLSLPGDVYFLDYVPFLIRPGEVAMILLATTVLAVGSAWIAAWRAASLQPVEALRR